MRLALTNGGFARVSRKDFARVSSQAWWAVKYGRRTYAVGHAIKPDGKFTKKYLHRTILRLSDRKIKTDHRDGDGLNCLRSNLRACSNQQNASAFRHLKIGKSSRFRGVSWQSARKQWVVQLRKGYRKIFGGRFSDEVTAAKVYDAMALKHFGSFAQPNFPTIKHMPVKIKSVGKGRVRVSTPNGVKAKSTTPAKAARQKRLLNAVEHSNWKPTGKPAQDIAHRVMSKS